MDRSLLRLEPGEPRGVQLPVDLGVEEEDELPLLHTLPVAVIEPLDVAPEPMDERVAGDQVEENLGIAAVPPSPAKTAV